MISNKWVTGIAVIIPAFNEAASIAKVLADIPPSLEAEIVVVNNSSSDDTGRIAAEKGATVVEEPRLGYGYACMRGVEYLESHPQKPDIVVFLDADYSDYPAEMTALIEPIFETKLRYGAGFQITGESSQRRHACPAGTRQQAGNLANKDLPRC